MKILLTAINAKYIHSNLAVYSLMAYCKEKAGIDYIDLLETTINNRVDDILDKIYMKKPDVVAFSCYIWNIEYVWKLIVEIKKLLPQCRIWLGGPEVSYRPKEILLEYPQVQIVMCGEGEETFMKLCGGEDDIGSIPGIVYMKSDEIVENPPVKPLDLSTIPFPYKDIDNLEHRIIYYESSRGCPFSCSYCLSSVEKQLRFRNIELVKKELGFFIENRVPLVKFVDRTFNCNRQHALAIWEYILENDNGITRFHFEIAADIMGDEEIAIVNKMRPGLIQLEIGVQSTNNATIHEIKRVMRLEKVREVVEKIRLGNNVHQHLDLIAGLPYEDYSSFIKSFNQVYQMEPNQLQLGFLKVLTGSFMAENTENYGIVHKNTPPYEVLYTNWITYDEILDLKMVEEAVEIYYNSGQFSNTIKYLEKYFDEPFNMYYEIGKYYKDNYPKNIKHSRIDRYYILKDWFETIENNEEAIKLFSEIMTYDIYLRENMHTRPRFSMDIEPYKKHIKRIMEKYELTRSEHVEPVSGELLKFLGKNEEKGFFIFDYRQRDFLSGNGQIRFERTEEC